MAEIEYFYSAHSAFAYIGSQRFASIARGAGRRIEHRPMDLRRVVAVTGPGSSNARTPERYAYFSEREIQRWAEYRGVPLGPTWPRHHDNDIDLPNCALIAALELGNNIDALAHAMLQRHWRDDADLADSSTLAEIIGDAGYESATILKKATTQPVKAIYEANTDDAIRRSVFGSPAYFVDGELFYGQDHLELMERALQRPFAKGWPARRPGGAA